MGNHPRGSGVLEDPKIGYNKIICQEFKNSGLCSDAQMRGDTDLTDMKKSLVRSKAKKLPSIFGAGP